MTTTDRLNIEVTQETIDAAIRADSNACVVADALKAALPDAYLVSVDLQTIRYTNRKSLKRYTYFTPQKCQAVLIAFDQGEAVEPFTYRLGKAVHIETAKPRPRPNGGGSHRVAGPRHVESSGRNGAIPTVYDGTPLPANPLLKTGRGTRAAKSMRRYGLKQLKP